MPSPPRSPLVLEAREWPPFFGGRLRLQMMMALSRWGPMRLKEIALMTGETGMILSHWNYAAKHLESLGLVIRRKNSYKDLMLGLNRGHPAYRETETFAKKLYHLYLAPIASWTPKKRRPPFPFTPCIDPQDLELHVLGTKPQMRMLHLLAEVQTAPGWLLINSLGLSVQGYATIKNWQRHGVLRLHKPGKKDKSVWSVHLDGTWPAKNMLYNLLRRLNFWLTDYGAITALHRHEQYLKHTTRSWRSAQTRRRRLVILSDRTRRNKNLRRYARQMTDKESG